MSLDTPAAPVPSIDEDVSPPPVETAGLAARPAPRWRGLALAMTLLVVGASRLLFWDSVPRGMFNDQGVELLQAADLPIDRFHFYAPSYHGGNVDQIESLVPYVIRVLGLADPDDLATVHVLFTLALVAGAALLFQAMRETHGFGWGLAVAALLALSSYGSYVNRILTRNGVSVLWAALLLFLLSLAVGEPGRRRTLAAVALPFALVASLMSYTSFKALFPAVPIVWLIHALRRRSGRRQAVLAAAAAVLAAFALAAAGGSSMQALFLRGAYVMPADRSVSTFAGFAGQSLLLPVHLTRHFAEGGFFIESVHALFGRAMLAPPLRPFFVIGVLLGLYRFARGRDGGHVAAVWLLGSLILSIGGPSLKTHYAFWPFVAWITVDGLAAGARVARRRLPSPALPAMGAVLAAAALAFEAHHLLAVVAPRTEGQRPPVAIARAAIQLTADHDAVLISAMGKDVITFLIRGHERVHFVMPDALDAVVASELDAGRRLAVVTDSQVPAAFADPRYARCALRRPLEETGRSLDQVFVIRPSCE